MIDEDLTIDRDGLLRWAQGETRRLAATLAKGGDCEHCVFYASGHCRHWNQPIPESHRATGCDHWRMDFVPF